MTLLRTSTNPDHIIQVETQTVLVGTKSFSQLIREELNEPKDFKEEDGRTDLSDEEIARLQQVYRTKYTDDTIVLTRKPLG